MKKKITAGEPEEVSCNLHELKQLLELELGD